ncbi:MAG: hypothetical protein EOO02_06680 [Chitinophagaceae bacterium]|nr:MAG: hypothetical protein EOO02_06680 [Chitinophagaceae bacterium]
MECNFTNFTEFNSKFSLVPLIDTWRELATSGREGSRKFYQDLIDRISAVPELLAPVEDLAVLQKHKALLEEAMATIFPVTLSETEDMYGILAPFGASVIYGSSLFTSIFKSSQDNTIIIPDLHDTKSLEKDKLKGAYHMILARLYNMPVPPTMTTVHSYRCNESNLDKFIELEIDTRFCRVKYRGELPKLPLACFEGWAEGYEVADIPGIDAAFELSNFDFEGMVVVNMKDVTEREVFNIIRNRLLQIDNFSDTAIFSELQYQIQNLVGIADVKTVIKPFYKVNNHLVISEVYTNKHHEKKPMPEPEQVNVMYNQVFEAFKNTQQPLLFSSITPDILEKYPFMDIVVKSGIKSGILCPLFSSKTMIGILIMMSEKENQFNWKHVSKLEPALPLFKIALEKTQQDLDHQVDRVIKDQFTAVQDAVEWRFNETALNYLIKQANGEQTKIEPITFNHVYPLYGAIDIRNSSVERNLAIQQDLLEQLNLAQQIIKLARQKTSFPLLDEIVFKLNKYIHAVNNILFADEEIAIHQFLKHDIVNMFNHIQSIMPSLEPEIKKYLSAIDSPVEMLYNHRKSYEESITTINNEVARFIDDEQRSAQQIFPHYFERFVTDGVDFNIYIGQSITPDQRFDFFYLKNLKIWQINTLAKAAILTNKLQKKLAVPLQTSQLILAHSQPISISFRTAERKFDVDGAYNIRYEIIKKRIDKVHIKNSNERLTQPGMLAIVYSQTHEATEYLEYIEFLQNQGLLIGEVERFDLEELQGVSGLRGLRVGINFDYDSVENKEITPSSTVSA